MGRSRSLLAAALALALAACGSGAGSAVPSGPGGTSAPGAPTTPPESTGLDGRLAAIDDAITRWQAAPALTEARAAAEAARNLVVGPDGPYYGDADGDGTVGGASEIGLLPGAGGLRGLATEAEGACVVRDVLGGSWSDPAARWATLDAAIEAWSPSNNTFPALPSHPQRIVGWSTLALGTDDLATALEYSGHARLHIDISTAAITNCR